MPMGIVSNDEFDKELSNCLDRHAEVVVPETPGRKSGDNNVPDALRKIIGETSELEGRKEALALAEMFGISSSSVSAYAKGAHSTDSYHKPDKGLKSYLRQRKDRVTKKALRVMQSAMHEITPESLKNAKPKDCASIAKDMSAIIKNMTDSEQDRVSEQQNNQFIFYAPQFMNEDKYEVIEARE